jgi:hypothetical protein
MMLKRAAFVAGLAAILIIGPVPSADACAVSTAHDHACCAASRPEEVYSCCSSTETPALDTVDHDLHCGCFHRPATPAAAAANGGSLDPGDHGSPIQTVGILAARTSRSTRHSAVERRIRSHPPPPVFLLDCAFLI